MVHFKQDMSINVPADVAWDALRDVGNLHTRLVRGFVIECQFDGQTRHLKFANGVAAAERIVAIHEQDRRVSWAAISERLTHHNASAQVFAAGPDSCRVVWIVDLLPDSMEPAIATMVNAGLQAMKATLESQLPDLTSTPPYVGQPLAESAASSAAADAGSVRGIPEP